MIRRMGMETFLTLMADLDDDTQERMSAWYAELCREGFIGVQTPGLPFHISLMTYPLDREQEAAEIARRTAASFEPVDVSLSHIGMFAGGKILFIAPDRSRELDALHDACDTGLPQEFPWTPHATMIIDEAETVHRALPILVRSFTPLSARITSLHLCAFWPTREIVSAELGTDR